MRTGTAQVPEYLEGALRRRQTGITPADVWDVAAAGDAVAAAIADRTARSLAAAAVVVASHLDLTGPVPSPSPGASSIPVTRSCWAC